MSLVHLLQPNNKTCGQTCVAMAVGVTVQHVLARAASAKCGRGRTTAKQLIKLLRLYGFKIRQGKLERITKLRKPPARAIIRLVRPKRRTGHWVLVWDGEIYDPLGEDYAHPAGVKPTGFIDLSARLTS